VIGISAGGAVQLARGVWALVVDRGLWIGVLGGDFESGWRSQVGLLQREELPHLRRALTSGGLSAGESVSVAADGRNAVLVVDGGQVEERGRGQGVLLDEVAAARLQVLCTARPRPAAPAGRQATAAEVEVVGRGVIEVAGTALLADAPLGARLVGIAPTGPGEVGVLTRPLEDAGTALALRLPALPVLLAAAEAGRDDVDVELRVRGADGVLVAGIPAHEAMRSSADAQWLLPALLRRAASPSGAL
jgi:hypothetical protein